MVSHLPGLRKGLGSLDWATAVGDQILKHSARGAPSPYWSVFPRVVGAPARILAGAAGPGVRLGPAPSPPGRSRRSALTLVAPGEGAHLDLRVPSRSVGDAAAGLKGTPGAWKAQGAGQDAQHLGAGWEGAKSPSTTPSAPGKSRSCAPGFHNCSSYGRRAQSPSLRLLPLGDLQPWLGKAYPGPLCDLGQG